MDFLQRRKRWIEINEFRDIENFVEIRGCGDNKIEILIRVGFLVEEDELAVVAIGIGPVLPEVEESDGDEEERGELDGEG